MHICIFTKNEEDKVFILYPQTFEKGENINKTKNRLTNIINELDIFKDIIDLTLPIGDFKEEYSMFQTICPKMEDDEEQIAFNDIYINNQGDIITEVEIIKKLKEKDKDKDNETLNFYAFLQHFFISSELKNAFIKYVIKSYSKKTFRNIQDKKIKFKKIKDKEKNINGLELEYKHLDNIELEININQDISNSGKKPEYKLFLNVKNKKTIKDEKEMIETILNYIENCNNTKQLSFNIF